MKLSWIAFIMLAGVIFYSCSHKEKMESDEEQSEANEWAEMDSFHMIMAEAFHPYKDSANLEPVKRLAEEMAQEAEKWAAASLPEKVKNDDMKAALNQLQADSRTLSDKIKGGGISDEEIGASLQALHDSFHAIMETWNEEGKDHQHQH